jgi:hypothetical protein
MNVVVVAVAVAGLGAQLSSPLPTSPTTPTSTTPTVTAHNERMAAGVYRLDVEVAVATSLPVVGEQRTTTRTTSLLVVDDAGMATAVACAVATAGAAFTSRLPPTSIQALPPSRFPIVVAGDHVHADMGEGSIGWRGEGTLPQTPDDPRVVDVDHDGAPGIRMDLDLGALGTWPMQVVTRGHTVLDGQKTNDGATGVLARMDSEQQVLSGLPVDVPVSDGPVNATASRFTLTRVDARDCATLMPMPMPMPTVAHR